MEWLVEPRDPQLGSEVPWCPVGFCTQLCFIDCDLYLVYVYETQPFCSLIFSRCYALVPCTEASNLAAPSVANLRL
jgi:hypothetical protein